MVVIGCAEAAVVAGADALGTSEDAADASAAVGCVSAGGRIVTGAGTAFVLESAEIADSVCGATNFVVVTAAGWVSVVDFTAPPSAPLVFVPVNSTVMPESELVMLYGEACRKSMTMRETSGENCASQISRTGSRLLAICFSEVFKCAPAKSKTSLSGFFNRIA